MPVKQRSKDRLDSIHRRKTTTSTKTPIPITTITPDESPTGTPRRSSRASATDSPSRTSPRRSSVNNNNTSNSPPKSSLQGHSSMPLSPRSHSKKPSHPISPRSSSSG